MPITGTGIVKTQLEYSFPVRVPDFLSRDFQGFLVGIFKE